MRLIQYLSVLRMSDGVCQVTSHRPEAKASFLRTDIVARITWVGMHGLQDRLYFDKSLMRSKIPNQSVVDMRESQTVKEYAVSQMGNI
jgi:hypothetical protein